MNILIIENSIGTTGAFKSILAKTELIKDKANFYFAIPKSSTNIEILKEKKIEYVEINFLEISKRINSLLFYFPILFVNTFITLKYVKKNKIDIIHTNDIYNLIGICCKLFIKVKVITHIRRMPDSFPRVIYNFWVLTHKIFADKIIAVSNANAEIFKETNKLEVLYNPYIVSEKAKKTEGLNKEKDTETNQLINQEFSPQINLLYLANYNIGKGQNHAIELVNILINKRKHELNVKVKFYGDDFGLEKNKKYKENLQLKVIEYNLEKYFEFYPGTKEIEKVIEKADIMLNLSDSESLSRVTMEGLYFGKPIIATNVGGTKEMITDGVNGYLVNKFDYESMCDYLYELIVDKNKREIFSSNNQITLMNFLPETISIKFFEIYSSVLNQ
jgi:glycosyltransferase involved in cell wall biosynthesis